MAFDPDSSRIQIRRGIKWTQSFILASDDAGATPLDLTGGTVEMSIRRYETDAEIPATITVTSASGGAFTAEIAASATDDLTKSRYRYDIVFTDSLGVEHQVMEGDAFVSWSPTKTPTA